VKDDNWMELVVLADPESLLDDNALKEVEDKELGPELNDEVWLEFIPFEVDEPVPDDP
jgi:hypothetical protein